MQRVAIVARDIVFGMPAGSPEREVTIANMTREANSGFLLGRDLLVVETENSAYAAAAPRLGVLERICMTGLAIRSAPIALLAVFGGQVTFDIFLVAAFADFRFRGDRTRSGVRSVNFGACNGQ